MRIKMKIWGMVTIAVMVAVFTCCESPKPVGTAAKVECPTFLPADKVAIMAVMDMQENAWSDGDQEKFMQGYWKSDSLTFVGSRGLTHGWQATLDNYRKGYPTKASMGELTFEVLKLEGQGPTSAFMIGKWHLTREGEGLEDVGGHFTLLWKKVDGNWVIVTDHTS